MNVFTNRRRFYIFSFAAFVSVITVTATVIPIFSGTFFLFARELVNTPVIDLTATDLAKQAKEASKRHGFSIEVLEKKQIESLKMGGLLAVNYGSTEPPVFIIMEHKPKHATNEKPLVLVGKGVVYDTGGLSLKPSNFMDDMKSDMGGAAAVIGAMS
ncbi:M17 family metallopeptidase, partial [Schleiferiaceae bacterium]|nr:M17 family metallopeptidase [Schleiferiaceae bacterium]